MTEEKKKAIEKLECFEPDDLFECAMYRECVNEIKNLIEKQAKEIEELKSNNYELNNRIKELLEED